MPVLAAIRQHPERSVPAEAPGILLHGKVAHVGFIDGDRPVVIPLAYHYDVDHPDRIYVHGSVRSRAMKKLLEGGPICITVTELGGLVYSRDAKYHSMNYRSVVCFGRAAGVVTGDAKKHHFRGMIARYFAGRTEGRDYAAASAAHLDATELVEVRIEEWSAKKREGGPAGPRDADPEARGTAGIAESSLQAAE